MMHPFAKLLSNRSERVIFMTPEQRRPYSDTVRDPGRPQAPRWHGRKGRRHRRRHIDGLGILIVAGMFMAAGVICFGCLKFLWTGVEDVITPSSVSAAEAEARIMPESENWESPVLTGVRDLTVYQGDTIRYLDGVAAADARDPAPVITVDSGPVDLSTPGTYSITYTATNAGGKTAQAKATVTVLERGENFVDLEMIYAAADAKLAQIIRENATAEQQVHDIYAYARLNLTYGGHSDRTDWRQTAYTMLTEGKGDCFGFFAVTKLLFERLGIPNIDVRKVKNSNQDSDHFWSLVSLDGGVTWYHFDSTPRAGEGDDFCLVTDAFLNAYSDAHGGSHNRDQTLYPATP